jgi:hypothetical protein
MRSTDAFRPYSVRTPVEGPLSIPVEVESRNSR